MEQVGYQIVHSIAGRIRIRVPWLGTDSPSTSNYQRLVEALSGVKAVRINPLAQSIIVEYYPRGISLSNMEDTLIALMQQVKLTPPATAPTVEHEPESVSEPPVSAESPTEQTSESSSSTEPPAGQNSEPAPASSLTSHSKSEPAIVAEIPSPWDEEPSVLSSMPTSDSEIELIPDEILPTTIEETMMSDSVCSTASLAKRLKVTSQAITRRRMKSDFGQWTQAQDPDGIAWNYHEHDRLFRPISTIQEME